MTDQQERTFRAVKVCRGAQGWGGPLVIQPTVERDKIVAVTGGGIPEVARRIAELTGGVAMDGFRAPPPESEIAAVVVDCGGTARAGVYPRKRIPTVNLTPVGQAGPLAQFITEDIYVSGVKASSVSLLDEDEELSASADGDGADGAARSAARATPAFGRGGFSTASPFEMAGSVAIPTGGAGGITGLIANFGRGIGGVVGVLFQAGRQAVDQVLRNVLPFMAFVTMLIGIINKTGFGDTLAHALKPLGTTLPGLLVLSVIVTLPFLSPILGPGAVVAQTIGVVIGAQIASGSIAPTFALPLLFAFDGQVGCDFVPVGLALGEAQPKTVEVGVPAVLFSRQITGPVSVLIAWVASVGLY